MDLQKAEVFVKRVCEKTITEELKWEKTPNDATFQAAIGKFLVRFRESDDNYYIELYDNRGTELDTYTNIDFDSEMRSTMREAYNAARRQARGVAQALDDILGELDKISGKWELVSQAGSKPNPAYFLTFKSDGVLVDSKGREGMKWKQEGTAVTLCFPEGAFDHLVLSDGGVTLRGTNSIKQPVVYTFVGD